MRLLDKCALLDRIPLAQFHWEERRLEVSKVDVGEHESLDRALRRLKKKIEREGILKALKARKHYEKPSAKRRRKMRTSKKRRPF